MEYQSLAPGARTLFHLKALVRLFIFWTPMIFGMVVMGAFFANFFWSMVLGAALWLIVAVLSVWYPSFAYERIQHVDTHQGPIDQLFGLSRLQIYTASGMGADGVIPGLDRTVAEGIREQLIIVGGDDGV